MQAEEMRSPPVSRLGFSTQEVDSFCLQIQYLNPHQCNARPLQATHSSSDSVCADYTLHKGYACVIYSICVCLCACIQLLLLETDVESANKESSSYRAAIYCNVYIAQYHTHIHTL